jgi:signal transduction histidine kinase
MNEFYRKALQKNDKLTVEQLSALLKSAAGEIALLESALDSLYEGILVCGADHHLILSNSYALRFLPPGPAVDGSEAVWEAASDSRVRAFLKKTLNEGDRIEEREFEVEKSGRMRIYSISVFPLVDSGRITGSLIHVKDTTDKRQAEARFRRAESLASLTTMAAGVAHEIKNPLGSLSIHVQLIQKTLKKDAPGIAGNKPAMDKYLQVINEEIERLNRIVVDFLYAVRPVEIIPIKSDLNALLNGLMDFVHYELESAHIMPVIDLEDKMPLVLFDERFMKQALLNLIKNAIAAMPEGGLLIVKTAASDTEAFISITDTGVGIDEEALGKIFEPYFTTRASGTGLGLTMVYKIIKEHGGEISVRSRKGEGASFIISLPLPQTEVHLLPKM